ncbi:helix-turn-helix domain-containing protein [Amycolatopsis sp. OK19-0408]|uniref:Helix-turn-helix domain-containing protein n=1 Tax=Amycolatopsis iheyensis TaxID=2945988 RepID=A0A9X2SJS2_9PSEU|nr:helix-turn-helix domain-containing protein [Amycolatopsis iheyensis]MCR6485032.1 helix-turn-helix domain-containing protein [Amycolatopsis iheyensis]
MAVVAVLALDGVVGFEVTIPGQVFGTANTVAGRPAYEIRVVAEGEITTSPAFGSLSLRTPWDLDSLAQADTILVPAQAGFRSPPPDAVVAALRAAAARGARIASMCVGAFTLAATGLLDGLAATTHWEHAAELARQYPRIDVRPSVLFVDHGALLTSAGVAAGLDLCLHLVRRDLGAAVAADTARRVVMPLQRDGGQAQFIVHTDPADRRATPLQDTLAWLEANLYRPLTLADIAAHAGLSVRSLNRHFRAQVGTTPLQWLLRMRVNRAQHLLETTDLAITQVARETGLGAAPTLRHHFGRIAGVSPQAYRAAFHAPSP